MDKNKTISNIGVLLITIGIVILINILGITTFFRIDLTSNDLYSLSATSKKYIKSLHDPVNIKVFFTKKLPAPYNSNERYLRDLLEEYSLYGKDNINYEFLDTKKNASLARSYGIPEVQVRVLEQDEVKFKKAYMGLVIIHGDWSEKIPVIESTDGLEYKISSLINKLQHKVEAFSSLDKDINVELLFSANLPRSTEQIKTDLSNAFTEMNEKVFGHLKYEFLDPLSDEKAMQKVKKYNIPEVSWQKIIGNRLGIERGYMGMVFKYKDNVEVIDVYPGNKEASDVVQASIENLLNVNRKIGYVTGHGEKDLYSELQKFHDIISQIYQIVPVDLSKDIPEDIDALIIAGSKEKYSDYDLFQLDQFIMKGNSVVFLMRNINADLQANAGQRMPMGIKTDTGLSEFLKNYGVSVNHDLVCEDEDNCGSISMSSGRGGLIGLLTRQTLKYPLLPILKGKTSISKDSIITEKIPILTLPFSSSMLLRDKMLKDNKIKAISLLKTSDKAWINERLYLHPNFINPPSDPKKRGIYTLGVQLEGKFNSYFKGKPVPKKPEDKEETVKFKISFKETPIIEKGREAKIVVIGTSDILDDNAMGNGDSPNANFIINIIDYLVNDSGLIKIRNKGLKLNPLDDISEATKTFIKWFNIIGLPIIVILLGLLVYIKRKTRKERLRLMFR